MQPLISIIIPCYNAAPWLHRCLDSVQAQTYTNWEALLINDGSTDNTAEILEAYAAKDTRFRVIHQQNAGVSAARNCGLREMKGEWMTWIDADDEILPEYLYSLESRTHNGNDLVVQRVLSLYERGHHKISAPPLEDVTFSQSEFPYAVKLLVAGSYCLMYRFKLIQQHLLRFNEEIDFGEDLLFNLQFLSHAKQIATSSRLNYHYHIREDSSCGHKFKGSPSQELALYKYTRAALLKISPALPREMPILSWFFYRIVTALYTPEQPIPRKERIEILRQLHLRQSETHTTSFFQYLSIKLLTMGFYRLWDVMMIFRHR